jgi:glycosyltransferase involved in cell wall biosynthesis
MENIGIYLSVGPHAGGSYQYCLSIIDAIQNIKDKKYKITFFIFNKKWKNKLPKNSKIIELKKNFFSDRIINFLKKINLPINIHKFFCFLFNKRIRIINNSDCSYVIFPSQEDECANIYLKSITTIHDLMHRYERKFDEYNLDEYNRRELNFKRICNYSDKIIVDSNIGKKQVVSSYQCKRNKIYVLPFTAPRYLKNSKIINIYKKYKIPDQKFIFYPAQFWEHKNHINLIQAFNIVKKKKKNLILVLLGKEKNNLSYVKKEIKKHKLQKSVFILGYIDQEDLFTFYKKALMMCFVSFAGPTNIPPLEAMFLGCPLICSNTYGMPKQVGSGGLLIKPNSSKDIAKKILRLFDNQALRKKIIKNGFKQYTKFNHKKFNIKFKKLIF